MCTDTPAHYEQTGREPVEGPARSSPAGVLCRANSSGSTTSAEPAMACRTNRALSRPISSPPSPPPPPLPLGFLHGLPNTSSIASGVAACAPV